MFAVVEVFRFRLYGCLACFVFGAGLSGFAQLSGCQGLCRVFVFGCVGLVFCAWSCWVF